MTTTLAPPPTPAPVVPPAAGGGRSARRAIRRWAWRLLRREWRQQLLVLALLTVAVAAITVGLGLVVNVAHSDQSQMGTASSRIDISTPGGKVAADIAAAQQLFGKVEAIEHAQVPVPGSITPVDLRAQDPHGTFGAPMLHLVSGSYPTGADQVAMTSGVAETFGVKIGDQWTANGRTFHLVGIVENPKDLGDAFALVAPGQIPAPSSLTLLTNAGMSKVTQFQPPSGSNQSVMSNGASAAQEQRNQALAVLLLATIGLTFIGLLAATGFTVMAQRRLRALGMIGAIGATDRQVRRVMVANGAAVGVVSASAGTVLGLLVWFGLRPAFEHLVGHRIDPLRLPWWAVIAGALLAIVCSLAASWWPARSAARMPIVTALSGRPAPPQPAHRFALLGVALGAIGFVLLVLADNGKHSWMIVTGIVASVAGMLLLAPLGIRALAATARRAPVAVRLALRDLARYQARSGAALAAASLAVGIAATIAISAAAQQANDHSLSGGNLPANQLIVWLSNPNGGGPGDVATAGSASAPSSSAIALARRTADAIATSLNAKNDLELDTAVNTSTDTNEAKAVGNLSANLVHPITENGHHGFSYVTTPYVATPAILAFYHVPASDIGPATGILTSRTDVGSAKLFWGNRGILTDVTIQANAKLPQYSSAPNTLITQKAMSAHGLTAQPAGWLLQTSGPLTQAQINSARHQAAVAGVSVESRTASNQSLKKVREYSTLVGLLLALGVLAMTVGLIRSETAGDLRTLTATGASGRTRRSLTAATAGALALLAGLLGTAGAYVALIAWHWRDLSYLGHPPYAELAVLIFGLPIVAVIGSWLLARTPATISRRPLE